MGTTVASGLVTALASSTFAQDAPKEGQAESASALHRYRAERSVEAYASDRGRSSRFDGLWKRDRATKTVGNIGKDLPGFKLPLTPAGEAALEHNLKATIDPESLCIIGGTPQQCVWTSIHGVPK